MTLIDNWKEAWRFLSVQVPAAAGLVLTVWVLVPDATKQQMLQPFGLAPDIMTAIIAWSGFIGGILARIKAQPELRAQPEAEDEQQ